MADRSLSNQQTETSQVRDENEELRTGILEGDRSSAEESAKVTSERVSQTEEMEARQDAGENGDSESRETEPEELNSEEVTWRGREVLVGVPKHVSWRLHKILVA